MNARIRKAIEKKDGGFTLVELLVVMIIIGILAAIAIPVFSSQQNKAKDTALKSDISTMGKEIAAAFIDGNTVTLTVVGASPASTSLSVNGTTVPFSNATSTVRFRGGGSSNWCLEATQPETSTTMSFVVSSSGSGIESAACSGSPTALVPGTNSTFP